MKGLSKTIRDKVIKGIMTISGYVTGIVCALIGFVSLIIAFVFFPFYWIFNDESFIGTYKEGTIRIVKVFVEAWKEMVDTSQ